MKHIYKYIKQSLLLVGLLSFFSCTSETPKQGGNAESRKEVVKTAGQFPFYKNLAVRPGLDFEVVSWGKGVDSIGAYMILMSDSLKSNYESISVEREGIIQDAWNMDLDNDGNPELYIELLTNKNQRDLNVYEFSGGDFRRIRFPSLPDRLKKVYGGNDRFTMKEGDLYRSFPVLTPRDSTEKAGDLKVLKYTLSGNTFSVAQVEEE
jgi:hypothetical protein